MLKTLTRLHISDKICQETNLSRQQALEVLESTLDFIGSSLETQGKMKISSFGAFYARQKGERIGRNPKTGEEVMITPRRSLSFRPSLLLKERVAKGNEGRGNSQA